MSNKTLSSSEILVAEFLEKAKEFQTNVELIKVLKARTYKIAEANVLIRAASEGNRRYFFGLNYWTVEEMANLDNPFIAFICGDMERTIIIPAKLLFNHLSEISHDRNGGNLQGQRNRSRGFSCRKPLMSLTDWYGYQTTRLKHQNRSSS